MTDASASYTCALRPTLPVLYAKEWATLPRMPFTHAHPNPLAGQVVGDGSGDVRPPVEGCDGRLTARKPKPEA